jgi:hypothetical protein
MMVRSHSTDLDVPFVGFDQPHHHAERGCFPGSVGTEQTIHLTFPHLKRDAIDSDQRMSANQELLAKTGGYNHGWMVFLDKSKRTIILL